MGQFKGVSAVEISQNAKIGTVSATYASQKTCPSSCPFYGQGCYAETGNVGFQTSRLNREARKATALQLAKSEASAIRMLTGKLPLRLHVVGDCTTDKTASTVAAAASEYRTKHGSVVWTYTHAWRKVSRESWKDVSVLASCETVSAAKDAMARGYGAAIVVTQHQSDKAYSVDGVKLIPCPQQTGRAANCEACKLCFNANRLRAIGAVIAFQSHGSTNKINSALVQISSQIGGK